MTGRWASTGDESQPSGEQCCGPCTLIGTVVKKKNMGNLGGFEADFGRHPIWHPIARFASPVLLLCRFPNFCKLPLNE